MNKGKDIGDYFRAGNKKEGFLKLVDSARETSPNKLTKSDTVHIENNPFSEEINNSTASKTLNLLTFKEWVEVIKDHFPKLAFAAEATASLFGQLLIRDVNNPCALCIIDMPSAGKTLILNLFSGFEKTLSIDNFTPASFVSQAANISSKKLKDIDLLPKIKNKVLIIRDLAPLFGQRDDDLLKNMGILTRVLDGEGLELSGGTHGIRGYSGDYLFMFLAASTPISPKVFKLMGNLGSRLFFLNIRSKEKSEQALARQLVTTPWKKKQAICNEATKGFLTQLWRKYPNGIEWNSSQDPEELLKIISRCALLLSKLRGSINIWKDDSSGSDYAYTEPVIERADRINQILYNIARGHALISGRTNINEGDLKVVLAIALDSAPLSRVRLFRFLIENLGEVTTEMVEQEVNCSNVTALREMEIFKILGIVDLKDSSTPVLAGRKQKTITLKEELSWFTSDECLSLLSSAEVLEETE